MTTGDIDDPEAVAIAHEALIREWGSLRGWVDKRREDIRFERELEHAEESWRKADVTGTSYCAAGAWKRRFIGSGGMRASCGRRLKSLSRRAGAGTR